MAPSAGYLRPVKLRRDPGAASRVPRIAGIVLLLSLLVGAGFAVATAISTTLVASPLFQVLVWLPRVGFVAAAAVLLAYEPHRRRRIRQFVGRPGWTAGPALERDFWAV